MVFQAVLPGNLSFLFFFFFCCLLRQRKSDATAGNTGAEQPPISRTIGRVYVVTSAETGGCDDGWQRRRAPLRTPFQPRPRRQFKAHPLGFASEEEASTSAAAAAAVKGLMSQCGRSSPQVPRRRRGRDSEPPSECCLHGNEREYELISQILPELTVPARRPVGPRRPTTWLSPEGAPKREPRGWEGSP